MDNTIDDLEDFTIINDPSNPEEERIKTDKQMAFGTPFWFSKMPNAKVVNAILQKRINALCKEESDFYRSNREPGIDNTPYADVSNHFNRIDTEAYGWQVLEKERSWHSPYNLQEDPIIKEHFIPSAVEAINKIAEDSYIRPPMFPVLIEAWAVVSGLGAYNILHDHGIGRNLAGVYYLKIPKETSAEIEFKDPRPAIHLRPWPIEVHNPKAHEVGSFLSRGSFRLAPKEGDFVFFPAWLEHAVTPNNTKDEDPQRIVISFNVAFLHERERELLDEGNTEKRMDIEEKVIMDPNKHWGT